MAEPSPMVRPVWRQFLPFVVVGFALQFLVLTVRPEEATDYSTTASLASAFLMLGGASYMSARWSGRRHPGVVAFVAAAAGGALVGVSGLWSLSMIVPVIIAIRPPTPLAYPVRFGLGVGMASLAAMLSLGLVSPFVVLVTGRAALAPLFGIWLADLISGRAVARRDPGGGSISKVVVGGVTGATVGVLLAVLATATYAVALGGFSDPLDPRAEDIGSFLVVTVTWAGLIGTGLGVVGGLVAALPSRRRPTLVD